MISSWTPYKIEMYLQLLTVRDLALLQDIEQFRLLSTRQIQRLHFGVGHATISAATRGTVRVLGRLEERGFLVRLKRRIGGIKHGSSGNVWQLSATGERLLRALRGDGARRRFVEPGAPFTDHTLEVADLAVRLREAARDRRFDLLELDAEPECWRGFTASHGGPLWLKPDLYVVTANAVVEEHAFVEVDRGTEHMPAILRKCAVYLRYFQTGNEQHRQGVFPAIVWVVPSEQRAAKLRTSIRGDPALTATLFRVTSTQNAVAMLTPRDGSSDEQPVTERTNHP
ncbi:replication-relaxation family protein [Cryobacterium lyxosi]|nr:replication-relaxation family protein [Cryobacterium lyxosi]